MNGQLSILSAGQDPGFLNRWGATSHTHMWVWLMFCIATFYKSQLKVKRGRAHPYQPPSGFIPFCSRHHAFKSDAVPISTEYQACSGLWWCEGITGHYYHSHLPFLPQDQFCSSVSKQLITLGRYWNFRKGVVLVDYTHVKIEFAKSKGGFRGVFKYNFGLKWVSTPLAPPLWIQPCLSLVTSHYIKYFYPPSVRHQCC